MNFYSYKITESENNFYVYVVSLFDDPNYTMETFEHYVANPPQIPLCQYFNTCDFDEMKIEKLLLILLIFLIKTYQQITIVRTLVKTLLH